MMTKDQIQQWKELRQHSVTIEETLQKMQILAEAVGDSEMRRYVFGSKHMSAMIGMRLDVVANEEKWRKA